MSIPPAEEIALSNGSRPTISIDIHEPDRTDPAPSAPRLLPNGDGGSHPPISNKFDTEWLDLSVSVIEDKETKILARALENGQLTKLKTLFLEGNAGDLGVRTMLNAMRKGHLTGLEEFIAWGVSSYDQITTAEEGTEAIADSLFDCKLSSLITFDLTGCLPKLMPARSCSTALADVLARRSCGEGRLRERVLAMLGLLFCHAEVGTTQTLECLRCQMGAVYSGDDGIEKIGKALRNCPLRSLKFLTLQENYIGDRGAAAIAKILRRGLLPQLEVLDLRNNQVGKLGANEIVHSFLRNPLLTATVKLDWPNFFLQEMATAFRENNIRLEVALGIFEIQPHQLVINEFKFPEYFLRRPQQGRRLVKPNHRLGLMCQADCSNANNFEDHRVQLPGYPEGGPDGIELRVPGHPEREPDGIELRVRKYFNKTNHFMDRELYYVDRLPYPGELQTVETPRGGVGDAPEGARDDAADAALKRSQGVHTFVMGRSWGFVGAAKDLGNQIGRVPSSDRYRCLKKLFQNTAKTKQVMEIIEQELLMLAERKPDEFYNMFGLRQVLLRNPEKEYKYCRVWICKSCHDVYHSREDCPVRAITTYDELEPLWSIGARGRP